MGNQNTKQLQGQSPVQIDHIRFQNARVLEEKGSLSMITTLGIDEKEYQQWKQNTSFIKLSPEYLLMPKSHHFASKSLCGSAGNLTVTYEYFPYLLIEQIQNRKKRKSKFQQCELWFLLFSLSAAQIQMKKLFDQRVGDIRPQNVFINQEGQIKLSCIYSWPGETSNFAKTFDQMKTLLAPQDVNKLQLGGAYDPKNYQSQMFSIGMTILSAATLINFNNLYDVQKFKFQYDEANEYLQEWRSNTIFSEIFTAFISNLCSFEPEKRLTEKELWSWINKYEDEIKNKDDFIINHAPFKIENEIQEMRNQSSRAMNMAQQLSSRLPHGIVQSVSHVPYQQQKSMVYPYNQAQLTEQRFSQQPSIQRTIISPVNLTELPVNLQQNSILQPRESVTQPGQMKQTLIESTNHQFPVTEYMYSQIPAQLIQKQYVTLPQTSQLPPQHQGQMSPQLFNQFQGQLPSHLQGQFSSQIPSQLQVQLQSQVSGQRQGQMVQGVIPNQNIQMNSYSSIQHSVSSQQQGYTSQKMMGVQPSVTGMNSNFVYTRRIIDPKTNSVVAEQKIGEQQYQRGIGQIAQPLQY